MALNPSVLERAAEYTSHEQLIADYLGISTQRLGELSRVYQYQAAGTVPVSYWQANLISGGFGISDEFQNYADPLALEMEQAKARALGEWNRTHQHLVGMEGFAKYASMAVKAGAVVVSGLAIGAAITGPATITGATATGTTAAEAANVTIPSLIAAPGAEIPAYIAAGTPAGAVAGSELWATSTVASALNPTLVTVAPAVGSLATTGKQLIEAAATKAAKPVAASLAAKYLGNTADFAPDTDAGKPKPAPSNMFILAGAGIGLIILGIIFKVATR